MKKSIKMLAVIVFGFSFQSIALAKALPINEIDSVSTVFPSNHGVEEFFDGVGTQVNLVFTLHGCVDKLGDVTYHYEEQDGQLHIYVAGQNIAMQASKYVRCIAPPLATRAIHIPEGVYTKENVIVHELKVSRAIRKLPAERIGGGLTCMAYWTGYELDETAGICKQVGRSGCSNPFIHQDLNSCMEAYGLK